MFVTLLRLSGFFINNPIGRSVRKLLDYKLFVVQNFLALRDVLELSSATIANVITLSAFSRTGCGNAVNVSQLMHMILFIAANLADLGAVFRFDHNVIRFTLLFAAVNAFVPMLVRIILPYIAVVVVFLFSVFKGFGRLFTAIFAALEIHSLLGAGRRRLEVLFRRIFNVAVTGFGNNFRFNVCFCCPLSILEILFTIRAIIIRVIT